MGGAARQFLMPTRLVHGPHTLRRAGEMARWLGMTRVLAVSDPAIAAQPFHAAVLDSLRSGGVANGNILPKAWICP